jgi:hypothetical protein
MKGSLGYLIVPLLFAATVAWTGEIGSSEVVAHFGEIPIYAEDLVFHIRDEVALVAVHFRKTYQADLSGKDWLKDFDGEVPVERVKQRALESCRTAKVIQVLSMEHGVGEQFPFPGFAEVCERVNQAWAKGKADGWILYGPLEYSPARMKSEKLDRLIAREVGAE